MADSLGEGKILNSSLPTGFYPREKKRVRCKYYINLNWKLRHIPANSCYCTDTKLHLFVLFLVKKTMRAGCWHVGRQRFLLSRPRDGEIFYRSKIQQARLTYRYSYILFVIWWETDLSLVITQVFECSTPRTFHQSLSLEKDNWIGINSVNYFQLWSVFFWCLFFNHVKFLKSESKEIFFKEYCFNGNVFYWFPADDL